jgi:hypothetical protein
MKTRTIHENLDTSFVNLSALIKYLRRRQFAGQVRIELSGYEADIFLSRENITLVREHDHIAGRVAEGQEAFQRVLIRSREPGGIVTVLQAIDESTEFVSAPRIEKPEGVPLAAAGVVRQVAEVMPASALAANGNGHAIVARREPVRTAEPDVFADAVPVMVSEPAPKPALPNLPFEFTNKVEDRARKLALKPEDNKLLTELVSEFLGTLDRSLAMAKLDFPSAFKKARTEIAADYPFLRTLCYEKGRIVYVEPDTNPKLLVTGILETVRRILAKLSTNPKFGEVYRHATQRLLGLLHKRRAHYDRFSMTKPLEKLLGV